jgi:hypothetical protein
MSPRGWIVILGAMILGALLAVPHLKGSYLANLFGKCSGGLRSPECPQQSPPAGERGGITLPFFEPPKP